MSRSAKVASGRKRAEREARQRAAERRRQRRFWSAVALGAVIVAAVLLVTWPQSEVGDTSAEAWDLPALDGEGHHALGDFAGKPTVAAFFASWCHVCERELPEFLAVSRLLGDEVNFVGINSQDGGRGMGDATRWGIADAWPLARDIGRTNGSGLSIDTFGARGMPLTVIYTPEGQVAHIQRGGISGVGLQALLNDLFGV